VADDPFLRISNALSRFLVGGATLADTLERVSVLTVDAIEPVDFVGLTMLTERGVRTGVFTDRTAPEIDQAQYDSGRGPCLDAYRTGEVIGIPSTADDQRYPEFSAAAQAHGILSTLSMPLAVSGDRMGAMNLYSRRPTGFDDTAQAIAAAFATQASVVLTNAKSYYDAVVLSDRTRTAMVDRETIDIARGILIASTGCTVDAALRQLSETARQTNTKLRDAAATIVRDAVRDTD
jgi:GAF domain-containing protein